MASLHAILVGPEGAARGVERAREAETQRAAAAYAALFAARDPPALTTVVPPSHPAEVASLRASIASARGELERLRSLASLQEIEVAVLTGRVRGAVAQRDTLQLQLQQGQHQFQQPQQQQQQLSR